MKIRQIRFRNINSFYGEHPPITFTEGLLSSTGLFVITGSTGAGKSTLLDVITLALFNKIPRISGAISLAGLTEEGLIINQQAALEPNTAAYAEVEYEVSGKAYRSRWSIRKNRNGNWNNYEMEISYLPPNELVGQLLPIKGLNEFPKKNEELIGLTYEQFVRSIVLAQGAFDQFLKAKAADRSKMLERITGTEIYRQLSQQAHLVNKQFEQRIAEKRKDATQVQVLTDEQVEQLKQQQKEVDGRLKQLTREIERYTAEDALLRQIAEADQQLKNLDELAQTLARKREAFAGDAQRLRQHEQVADLATRLSELAGAEANQQREVANQQKAGQTLTELDQRLSRLVGEAQTLTQKPDLTEATLVQEVTDFQNAVRELTQQIRTEQAAVSQLRTAVQKLIDTAKDPWLRQLSLNDLEATLATLTNHRHTIGVELVQLEAEYPALSYETIEREINQLIRQEKNLTGLHAALEQQQNWLGDGMTLNGKIDQQQEQIEQQKPQLSQLADEVEALEKAKTDLEKQKIRLAQEANLEKLREALQSGEPCPLCGSVEHPYAQHYINETGKLEVQLQLATADWQAKKKQHDALNNRLIQMESEKTAYTKQRDDLRRMYSEKRHEITQQMTELALDALLGPEQILDQLKLVEIQRDEFRKLQSLWEQETTLQRLESDFQTIRQSQETVQQLIQRKKTLYAGDDSREVGDRLVSQFNTLSANRSTQTTLLRNATEAVAGFDRQITTLAETLLPVLQERGFADMAAARACLLDAQRVRQWQQYQQTLDTETHEIQLKQGQERARKEAAAAARQTDLPLDEVVAKLKGVKAEERRTIENRGYVKNQLEHDRSERKRHQKLLTELTTLETEANPWRELDRLIGSAKGDTYSKFAQGLTLVQLIGLTNRRLKDLSDRYLLLKPRDGQEDLYVVDLYQGSTERSVSSLSGGETFTLSLALALGLSDLASQNVQIDSLFIDEGFGTLDPETLDTAVAMLEKLQHDGQKTIGIISHRHEIKERISVQIQVDKGIDGKSKIRTVEI